MLCLRNWHSPETEKLSDVHINVVQGGELGEAGEFVERALDVTLNPNAPFPLNRYQFLSNIEQKHSKNKEKIGENIGNQTRAKYLGIKSKRCSKEDVDQSSDTTCTDRAMKKPKKTWTFIHT